MSESKGKTSVFEVECPCCHARIWIDPKTEAVIKTEKGKAKRSSLDDLLLKEKKKKEETDRRFTATAELAEERKQKAREMFEKALTEAEQE